MAELLLSYLFPKFRGSKEDLVTLSLCHILESSEAVNEAFTDEACRRLQLNRMQHIRYKPQATGEKRERPDVSGTDAEGNEMIICEAKFFAGLTENQPGTYLERLIGRLNTGLIFICPETRIISLWKEVTARVSGSGAETIGEQCVSVHGAHMSIISWNDLMGILFSAARQKDQSALADLSQLEGLCRKIEDTDFIPFSDDDLSISTAKNIERYYITIDNIWDSLSSQSEFPSNTRGKRQTGLWGGYVRFIDLWDVEIGLVFSTNLWKDKATRITPFWIWMQPNKRAVHPDKISQAINMLISSIPEHEKIPYGATHLSLTASSGLFSEESVADLTGQVLDYVRRVKANYEQISQTYP